MSLQRGVINPEKSHADSMFIGWAPMPRIDRRFLLGALPVALATTSGASYLVASNLSDPGAGAWLTGATHTVTGVLSADPYPMIRVPDDQAPAGMRSVLIVAEGKCTSGLKLKEESGRLVKADGVLVERKGRQMLEVPLFLDKWLSEAGSANIRQLSSDLVSPIEKPLGTARLRGNIMDTKCFFGVMRPGRGKTHKACASLCIRGGIPPSFWARTRDGRESVLLMTDAAGGPIGQDVLPLVADPVEAEGEIVLVGDLLQFRADVSAYKRT